MSITAHLFRYWTGATAQQRREGRRWYEAARALVAALARQHGAQRTTVAGIVAATSPRLNWRRNIEVTREILAGRTPRGVFTASRNKALRILAGAKPLCVLGGDKVRAFYRALLGDRTAAVIDVWMVRAAGMDPESRLDRGGLYARVAGALVALARRLRIGVAELQATIWVAARGRAA